MEGGANKWRCVVIGRLRTVCSVSIKQDDVELRVCLRSCDICCVSVTRVEAVSCKNAMYNKVAVYTRTASVSIVSGH